MQIRGGRVTLQLLTKEELILWLESPSLLEEKVHIDIVAQPIEGNLRRAFEIKISNMDKDPGFEQWYSYFAIIFEGRVVGTIGAKGKPDSKNIIEVGYGIDENYYNQGIVTEALGLFSDYFIIEYGVDAITANTDRLNIASQKVLIKNGFIELIDGDVKLWIKKRP